MKVRVRVRPGAKTEKVEQVSETEYRVWVKAPPREGKANAAVVEVLSRHFKIPRRSVVLLRGESSRDKLFEIE